MSEAEAQQLLPGFVDELNQIDITAPPDLQATEVKDLFSDAKKWTEMGEYDFWTK